MATEQQITYYKSWVHERNRARRLGKPNYEANCDIELDRLVKEVPDLAGTTCDCPECRG